MKENKRCGIAAKISLLAPVSYSQNCEKIHGVFKGCSANSVSSLYIHCLCFSGTGGVLWADQLLKGY